MAEEVTFDDVVKYVSGSILTCPEDDVWDTVHDWILTSKDTIILSIDTYISVKVDVAKSSIKGAITDLQNALVDPVTIIKRGVTTLLVDMITVLDYIRGQAGNWASGISGIITSITNGVSNIIGTTINSIANGVAKIIPEIAKATNSIITNLGKTIATTFNSIVTTITTAISSIVSTITTAVASLAATAVTTMHGIAAEIKTSVDWLADFALVKVPEYIDKGVSSLLDTLMDFTTWIPKLLTSVMGFLEVDIPGSSPQGEGILEKIFRWIVNAFKTVIEWVATNILRPIVSALVVILSAIAEIFRPVTEVFLSGVLDFLKSIGPISPQGAIGATTGLANIGILIIGMLGAMTVAGHLVHPFQSIGLGEVSAMVWDLSQYSVVTGAFMGVVAAIAIRTPMTYYLNQALRPHLPNLRDAMEMYSNEAIEQGGFHQLLAYHGLADEWHNKYDDIAFRAVSVYSLRNLAASGLFDAEVFSRELTHAGYRPEIKQMLLKSWQTTTLETPRGMLSGTAMTRYKEGYSDEHQFEAELRMLGYPDEQIPIYVAGAKLAYATDYLSDMKAAYTAAANKGQISLSEYRSALQGLGIQGDRVAAFAMRIKATLNPKAKVTTVTALTPVYETDAGKLQVDTLRRQRRKALISRDEELAGLLGLGMEVSLANSTAANDDVRLAEKASEE